MKQPQDFDLISSALYDKTVLSDDELQTLAKFLDVLMEADFEIKRNKGLSVDEG